MLGEEIGKVSLVGAGPGDPKLITLRGKELLAEADTVIYDYLANPKLLDFLKEGAEKIYVGKKGGSRSISHQEKINSLMIEAAQAGRQVVRLKGGDPFIFGRGGEEAEALVSAGIPFEIVPGVSSAIAVPAYAGISLTHREVASSVAFITGHEDPHKGGSALNWAALATSPDTLVVLMGMGNLPAIIAKLVDHGRPPDTPIALIQWGSTPSQRTVVGTLETIVARMAEEGLKPPVVMVIGKVVALRAHLNWYESRPLFGKRVLITRAKDQAIEFNDLLTACGAEVVPFPTLQIVPPPRWTELDAAIRELETYDTIIFTSVNGVRAFRKRLYDLGEDLRLLKGITLCAIGPRTAQEIEAWGLRVDLVPAEFKAEGVLDVLEKAGIRSRRFLIPRAAEAREILPDEIKKRGGEVCVAPAYQAFRPAYDVKQIESLMTKKRIDVVTFASSSTLRNFMEIIGEEKVRTWMKARVIACIGPITAGTAREFGLRVDIIPKKYTFPDLAASMVDYYRKKE
ncbi:MAG TPA: uroporphyrinogen-III C-methyltransferase [Nitrospiria bacterium]|nr:uroporphyrinogen-III C-methyltransferase [Candidatus Manganitrophaceae bacterium]HIL35421.1 uroporphyrinogen-III C-methyltransferase [Candidatus Manganitrophaceae bacterium]